MGQIHSDRRKIESSYKKYKYSKHTSEIDVNQQHCTLPGSKHESMNKKILYQSQSGNMDDINDQTNTVNTGASNSTENVFQNSSDDCDTVQELSSINLDTPSTSIQCASMKKDESSVQKNISFEKSVSENTEISQIKNNSSSTGTVVKPQKSLHRFCNITSNLRRSNAKSLFTPKRHKSVKSAHEINSCFNNTDTSKGSFNKKKRSNWVTRFNCTKLKCNKSTDHHSLSNSVTNVEKQSSNANCVCMCYRKKAENVLMSDIKLHNENSVTNQIATQSNPQVNSIISVTVQNLSNERVRRMCRPVEYQSNSVDSINITEYRYRAVRKSSIPTLASNSSENNLITMCKCSNSNSCCSPLNIRGETSTDSRRKLHHRSVTTVNNSVSHHNDNRDIYNITEVTDSKLNSVFNVLPNRDNIQNQSSEISGSESLYGSLSDINNPQIVLDMPIDLVRLTDCNSDAATINNHTSNCVQMLYSKGTDSPHRCMQLVCHSDEISNRSNLTNHSNSQCSHNMSDDCFKQSNGHCSLEPQLNSEIHNRQTNSSNIEENTENSSQNSNDQSVHAHVNSSGSEQHVCSNKIIIPGQRRCLQLMCPTDISMESLKILFQSHFSSDTVVKCHTQIDYVHYLVPDLLQITSCSFYWGKMDRYEAERLLDGKPEGTFLLRDSAQEEFLFSVSFRKYGRSLHARIEQWNHKFSFDSHDPGVYSSSTVCGLIEHYKDPTCCMFFEPILTLPLHRNFTFTLQHLCRATITNKLKYDMIDLLQLPNVLKSYLKEYHYRQRVRVKRFDGGELQWVDYSAS